MTHMTCGRVCRPARRGSLLAQESSEGQAWAAAETISTNLVSSLFLSYSGAAAAAEDRRGIGHALRLKPKQEFQTCLMDRVGNR